MLLTMAIESPCPGCGVVLAVPDEHAGKQARCPECSALFVVPQKSVSLPPANLSPNEEPDTANAPGFTGPLDGPSPVGPEEVIVEAESADSPSIAEPAISEPEIPVAEAPPPDHRQWWLKTPQGAIYGPISKDQLDTWCEDGRIADDCHVKHEEEHAWRGAAEEYPILEQSEPPPVAAFAAPQGFQGALLGAGIETSEAPMAPRASARPTVVLPHRGVIITALGFASWITLVCPVFGVIAWNMGNRDLELMYSGQMDASGMRMTHLGRLLGLIHVLTFVTLLILGLGFAVIFLVMQ